MFSRANFTQKIKETEWRKEKICDSACGLSTISNLALYLYSVFYMIF